MKQTYPLGLPAGEFLWMCKPCKINVNYVENPDMEIRKGGWSSYEPTIQRFTEGQGTWKKVDGPMTIKVKMAESGEYDIVLPGSWKHDPLPFDVTKLGPSHRLIKRVEFYEINEIIKFSLLQRFKRFVHLLLSLPVEPKNRRAMVWCREGEKPGIELEPIHKQTKITVAFGKKEEQTKGPA